MNKVPFNRYEFDSSIVARALGDPEFRRRLLAEPKETYERELGIRIPAQAQIIVVEERPDAFYIVLPYTPKDVEPRKIEAVSKHILTHREPCWGLGDGLD